MSKDSMILTVQLEMHENAEVLLLHMAITMQAITT